MYYPLFAVFVHSEIICHRRPHRLLSDLFLHQVNRHGPGSGTGGSTMKSARVGFYFLKSLVCTVVALLAAFSAEAQDAVTPLGEGTDGNPYQISQLGHLVWIHENVDVSAGKYYALQNDIDAFDTTNWHDGCGFTPIGNDSTPFGGTFAGNGFAISGLLIDRSATYYVGLFGYVGSVGVVSDLSLTGILMAGDYYVGMLAGRSDGTVSGCRVEGPVTGGFYVGGLVGINYGRVSRCAASVSVTGNTYVGGLVGFDYYGTIDGCSATGSVSGALSVGGLAGTLYSGNTMSNCTASCEVTGGEYAGGLVGNIYAGGTLLHNCSASGEVSGSYYVGGLVGVIDLFVSSTIIKCYATGDVTATRDGVGGLVGGIFGVCSVIRCYATGDVTGNNWVGGLVGSSGAELFNCYARGSASGNNVIGGLMGRNYGSVNRCYAAGPVIGTYFPPLVGGLVGQNQNSVGSSYWDTNTSGQAASSGGTGYDTAAMMQQATFEGWDFTNVWAIVENETYPVFATWIIGVSGVLAFGEVPTGQTATAVMTITNSGNAALTISGIDYPAGFSGAWSGILAPGEATNVTVTFSPVAAVSYGGTVTVNSDKTEGTDTIDIWGAGVVAPTPGQICFAAATYAAQEGVKRKIVVRRINGSDGTVSVQYTTKAKTALAGQDYLTQSGTLTWTNGQTASQTIKLAIPIDGKKEPNETFQVLLKNPVGTTLAAPAKTTVTISGNSK